MPLFNLAGKRPADLGVTAGRLAACPPHRANCVVSQHEGESRTANPHHIAPFPYEGDPGDAMTRVMAVLMQTPGCQLVSHGPDYIHAEFTSRWLGMVDDVEFLLRVDEEVIHVRSASRWDLPDLGVNRARLEALRVAFDEADN